MNWRIWRRRQTQVAKESLEQSQSEREQVDALVMELRARRGSNHFAPAMQKAFKGR